jgi:hypothetical protein
MWRRMWPTLGAGRKGTSASFPDSDYNLCDCPTPEDSCNAVSASLTPPSPAPTP